MDADDLRRLAADTPFDVATLEKDYALTWLLHGIYSETSSLRDVLVFKGGTALRKVYAPEWRLSEDLDFTILQDIQPDAVSQGFEDSFAQLSEQSGLSFQFSQIHTQAYYIQARAQFLGPLGYKNTIKLDISLTEKLIDDPTTVEVEPEYNIPPFTILVYTLNEILIEKLRSIMQRGYARDYYDTWRLITTRDFDATKTEEQLVRKCERTEIEYQPDAIFDRQRLSEAERHWETALARLTPGLPPFRPVIEELRAKLTFLEP